MSTKIKIFYEASIETHSAYKVKHRHSEMSNE
jgi:hypothetical protein